MSFISKLKVSSSECFSLTTKWCILWCGLFFFNHSILAPLISYEKAALLANPDPVDNMKLIFYKM